MKVTNVELLRADAEYAHGEVMNALEGVTQAQAWAVLPNLGPDYLHTDGSIHGLVHHMAGCKRVHASVAFRNAEYRWRDLHADVVAIEPDWDKALAFLEDSHRYCMDSWKTLKDEELLELRPTNWKSDRSALDIIRILTHHDSYHAGQIAVIRYGIGESETPPPSVAEDIMTYCRDMRYW